MGSALSSGHCDKPSCSKNRRKSLDPLSEDWHLNKDSILCSSSHHFTPHTDNQVTSNVQRLSLERHCTALQETELHFPSSIPFSPDILSLNDHRIFGITWHFTDTACWLVLSDIRLRKSNYRTSKANCRSAESSADYSVRTNLHPLSNWKRRFWPHFKHGCLRLLIFNLLSCILYHSADPQSRESYDLSIRDILPD
jgi:hypothetical protein